MVITTSWDDGDILDERVADMLDRYGLRGTFYLTRTHRQRRLSEPSIRALAARHEIGAHSLSHPNLTQLDRKGKTREVAGSKSWLEDVTGEPLAMFCYPFRWKLTTKPKRSSPKPAFAADEPRASSRSRRIGTGMRCERPCRSTRRSSVTALLAI